MLDDVKELHIEPTSICNAECPMCARNILGQGLNPNIKLGSLTVDWFKKNISSKQIAKLDKVFFCGNVGDPAACPGLLDIIEYFKKCNESIVLGLNTNGGLKTTSWWSQLGELLNGPLDYCVFSIDGLEDTNHLYRRNVKWRKVMENARSYISTGASAHWDMLVFKHNKHQVSEVKELANRMGFSWFRTKETDRWDIYPQSKDLKPASEFIKIEYGSQINCEIKRDKSVYLDHTGKFWPCCHMAEGYLSFIGREMHNDIRKYNNTQLFEEYKTRLENNTPFYVCKRSCGLTTGKKSQWKTETQLK